MNEEKRVGKVTLEDLLTIKRAERPAPDFWPRFEEELRAKQLAAIIEKRPWWRTLSIPHLRWSRLQLPLGAAAILAVTLMSVREYRQTPASHRLVNAASSTSGSFSPAMVEPSSATVSVAYASPVGAVPEHDDVATAPVSTVQSDLPPGDPSEVANSGLLASESLAAIAEPATAVGLGSLLPAEVGFESRGMPARSSIAEPLAQLATPKSVRLRDRYLGGAMPAGFSAESVGGPADHGATRLRDRQLRPEDFSRFDARGNSLSIKL